MLYVVDLEDRRLSKTAPGLLKSRGGNQLDSQDNRATTAPSVSWSILTDIVDVVYNRHCD